MRLGLLLDRAGRSEEAVRALRQSLAILTAKLDALDPERAEALGYLADVLSGLGRDSEAEPLYRERRAVLAAALGRDHPDYEKACVSLADALVNLGRPDEAEPLLRETLEIARGNDGPAAACIPALTRLGWHLAQAGPLRRGGALLSRGALRRRAGLRPRPTRVLRSARQPRLDDRHRGPLRGGRGHPSRDPSAPRRDARLRVGGLLQLVHEPGLGPLADGT